MKLLEKINIKLTPTAVLFMSAVSTLLSGAWLLLVRYTVNKKALIGYASYYGNAVEEIAYCAMLHIALALVLHLSGSLKQEERR